MKNNKYGYPLIENEEQYWEEFNKWKKEFNKINSLKSLSKDPFGYILKLDKILKEGVQRDLIEEEYYIHKCLKNLNLILEKENNILERKLKNYLKRRIKMDKLNKKIYIYNCITFICLLIGFLFLN